MKANTKQINLRSLVMTLCAITFLVAPETAYAFGRKRPKPPQEPADTQAYPTRVVSMGRFSETPFLLPDGKTRVDMSVVLPELVLSELSQATTKLRARGTPDSATGETRDRFVFRGGITSFEAENTAFNIRFGYKPGVGDIGEGVLTGVEGKLAVTVSSLGMDYNIVDTIRDEVVAAGTGSALIGSGKLEVTVDFSVIQTGADFVFKSAMAPAFRRAARRAIDDIVRDPKTNFLMDWEAQITAVRVDLNRVFFNSGARDDITVGNVFTVYDRDQVRLGEIKVREAQHDQSVSGVKGDANGAILNSVRPGDTVKIYFQSVP